MGNGEIWGIGGAGILHDIFHQLLICPVDALLDLGLRDQIERDLGVSRVFGLAGSVWKGMGSEGVLMFSVWQLAASPKPLYISLSSLPIGVIVRSLNRYAQKSQTLKSLRLSNLDMHKLTNPEKKNKAKTPPSTGGGKLETTKKKWPA